VWNFAKLACLDPALEVLPDAGIRCVSHAACQRGFQDHAAVLHRRSLEYVIPRPRHGPLGLHLRFPYLVLSVFARLGDYSISLVPILSGQFTVSPQDLSGDESPSVIQIERFAHTQFYIAFARYMEEVGLRASFGNELQQSQQMEFGNRTSSLIDLGAAPSRRRSS
jgi:hypothetical protein